MPQCFGHRMCRLLVYTWRGSATLALALHYYFCFLAWSLVSWLFAFRRVTALRRTLRPVSCSLSCVCATHVCALRPRRGRCTPPAESCAGSFPYISRCRCCLACCGCTHSDRSFIAGTPNLQSYCPYTSRVRCTIAAVDLLATICARNDGLLFLSPPSCLAVFQLPSFPSP